MASYRAGDTLPQRGQGSTLSRPVPYRTPHEPQVHGPPDRAEPPALLALGVRDDAFSAIYRSGNAANVASADGATGRRIVLRGTAAAVVGAHAWALFVDEGDALVAHTAAGRVPIAHRAPGAGGRGDPIAGMCPLATGDEPGVLIARRTDDGRGLALSVRGVDLAVARTEPWLAPASSRALLAATQGSRGPLAVLATDRDDEVDLSSPGTDASRTVSLGRAQRFECAAGGGGRVVVVSRGAGGLVVRTLARDLRSELNPVPIAPRPGARIGKVRCVHVGAAFVIAHEERLDDVRSVAVTVFDGRAPTTLHASLPALDALVVDGGDVVLAAAMGGASGPQLLLYKLQIALDPRGVRTRVSSPRRYACLLECAPCRASDQRRAALADVASAVAMSLGAPGPDALALYAHDAATDVATFAIRGSDAAHDVRVALRARGDGSGDARVAIGPEIAETAPPGAGLVARLRDALRSHRAGAGAAMQLEFAQVSSAVGPIVSAVFGLRCVA